MTPRMRTPSSESKAIVNGTFASSHETMREEGKTGTVEPVADGTEGGAVFLNGAVVYARYGDEAAEDALEHLLSSDGSRLRASSSTLQAVRMFRTYMRYISDGALITAEPLEGAIVEQYEAEGVIVQGVRNTAGGSWGDETGAVPVGSWTRNSPGAEIPDRSVFPEGRRTALAPDAESLRRHVAEEGATGYAAGDGEVITFRGGELVDGKRLDIRPSVRADVGAGAGWVVVDASSEEDKRDGAESGGLLSRLF